MIGIRTLSYFLDNPPAQAEVLQVIETLYKEPITQLPDWLLVVGVQAAADLGQGLWIDRVEMADLAYMIYILKVLDGDPDETHNNCAASGNQVRGA